MEFNDETEKKGNFGFKHIANRYKRENRSTRKISLTEDRGVEESFTGTILMVIEILTV